MGKNKNKKTGIYFYAKEYATRRGCGIQKAIERTYDTWKSLSAEKKAIYEAMAAEFRAKDKEEREKTRQDVVMQTASKLDPMNDERLVNVRDELRSKVETLDLKRQKWYFIKIQMFCNTVDISLARNEQPTYVLAEIGLVEYSIEEGVTNEYYAYLRPEKIPPGCSSMYRETSEALKIPPERLSDDYQGIYQNILKFTGNGENEKYSPLFCIYDDYNEVKFGINWLYERAKVANENIFKITKIIDLQSLMICIKSIENDNNTHVSATEILNSDLFDLSTDCKCRLHEDEGVKQCALSFVKRYAFMFAHTFSKEFNVKKVAGKHYPLHEIISTDEDSN